MRTIFQNCTLLDGTEQMTPRPGTDVAIENDRIAQIGKITPNKGDRVVPCRTARLHSTVRR